MQRYYIFMIYNITISRYFHIWIQKKDLIFRISSLFSYWRKLGDSNPRYGYPYVSLANWWFQPLTQTSFLLRFLADSNRRTRFCRPLTKPLIQGTNLSFHACIVCFSIAVAKVRLFFESASVSMKNFDEIAIFFHLGMFFHECYIHMDTPHKGCHHTLFA